jgi:hypothetical protein
VTTGPKTEASLLTKRKRLKQFLLQEIEKVKQSEDDSDDEELLATLYAAVNGLENLEYGQIDEIFAPADAGYYGLRPATVKLCQARAIGFVLLLKERGESVEAAEEMVAKEFVIGVDALRQWKKTVGKTTDARLQEIIKSYTWPTIKFAPDAPIATLLAEVKRVGEIYQKARAAKIVKKT